MTGSPGLDLILLSSIVVLIVLIAAFIIEVLRLMREQPAVVPPAPSAGPAPESPTAVVAVQSAAQPGVPNRAWRFTDQERLPEHLQAPTWAGAVLHAFDADRLLALVPALNSKTGNNRAGAVYRDMQKLSFVEAAPDQLHCIHAPRRAEMLLHLWTERRESYRVYARRAAQYYSERLYSERGGWGTALGRALYCYVLPYTTQPALQIEWLYHLAIAEPDMAVIALRFLAKLWTDENRYDDVNHLLLVLAEHVDARRASEHLTAAIYYFKAQSERRARRLHEALADLEKARNLAGDDVSLRNDVLAAISAVADELNHSQAVTLHDAGTLAAYRVWTDRIGVVRRQWRWRDALQQIDRRDESLKHHQELLSVYRAAHNVAGEAHTTRVMGDEYLLRDQPLVALHWYEDALGLYRRAGNHFDEAATQQALGDLYQLLGRFTEALPHYDEALKAYHALRAPLAKADTLKARGDTELALAHISEAAVHSENALKHYDEASTLYHEQGADLSEAAVLVVMGNALVVAGRPSGMAQDRYADAREIYARLNDRLGEANACLASGDQQRQLGRSDLAEADFTHALKLFRLSRDRVGEANALLALGQLADGDEAVRLYTAALDSYRAVGASLGEARTLAALGNEYRRVSNLAAAQAQFKAAGSLYTSLSQLRGAGDMHLEIGRLAELDGRSTEAATEFDRALNCYEQLKYLPGQAQVWQARGEQSLTAGYPSAAEAQLNKARELYRDVFDDPAQAVIAALLAEVPVALKQRPAAIDAYQTALDQSAKLLPARRNVEGLRGWLALANGEYHSAMPHFEAAAGRDDRAVWQLGLGLAKLAAGQTDAARAILSAAWLRADPQERATARRWLGYLQSFRSDLTLSLDDLGLKG